MDNLLELLLSGGGIKPANVRSKDIAEVIASVEDMIASVVIRDNPELKKENIIIGLSGIYDCCINMTFQANLKPLTIPAINEIINSITNKVYQHLPFSSLESIRKISKFTYNYNCEAKIKTNDGKKALEAVINPETRIPITNASVLTGETTLYGEIKKAGGEEPKIQFKPNNDKIISCRATKELTKKAGSLLYTQVALEGIAQWDTETLDIKDFTISEITEHEQLSPIPSFKELADAIGDWADGITDVNSYSYKIRYGNVES
ncbi:MAG: hypothetical protein HQK64_00820 [Desulfamplus sp.]|nr:hypothetical protein [Desulfamplus sp.]